MSGVVKGSIVHIHRARTVIVDSVGMITASELGIYVYIYILQSGGMLLAHWILNSAFQFNAF